MSHPRLHVKVDPVLCQGTGYCVRLAPDVFELGEDQIAQVLTAYPDDDRAEVMEEAAILCPTRAITH